MQVEKFPLSISLTDRFKIKVGKVDLPAFLLLRRTTLQQVADTDFRTPLPPKLAVHLSSRIRPTFKSDTVWIGVWKQDHFAPTQRPELLGLRFTETTSGEPEILRIHLRKDDSRLLRLDNCTSGPGPRGEFEGRRWRPKRV